MGEKFKFSKFFCIISTKFCCLQLEIDEITTSEIL